MSGCKNCDHPRAWHNEEHGCMWLSVPGVKGCPCRTYEERRDA